MALHDRRRYSDLLEFSQQRCISLSPFHRERNGHEKDSPWKLLVDVRVDIDSSVSTHTPGHIITPFPKDVVCLLTKYGATRILIQSGSSSSSSFPSTSLDEENDSTQDRHKRQQGQQPHLGPSGVSVRVQFITSEKPNNDKDNADILLMARFLGLLQELVDQRWILAPLDMVTSPRLHRVIYPTTVQNENNINNNSTNQYHTLELETILPMDGSAVSAEGLAAFLFGPSNTCPSPDQTHDWDTSLAWSSILLGTSTLPAIATLSEDFHRRRSMWLDLQSSWSCHEKVVDGEQLLGQPCSMTVSQGVQYAAMIESKRPSSSSSPQQQQKFKKNKQIRISLDENVLPKQLLQRFGWCHPHSTSTRLELVAPKKWNVTWPLLNSSHLLLESSGTAMPTSSDQPHRQPLIRRVYSFDGPDNMISLPQKSWMKVRPPRSKSADNDETGSLSRPVWTVERAARRPRGVAMEGILQTIVGFHPRYPSDNNCPNGMMAELVEAIPNYIRPRWRSLTTQMIRMNQTRTVHDSPIRPSDIKQTVDGSLIIKWRIPLPSDTSFSMSVDYDYVLVSFEDFPADPNRGMEMPPSIATFYCAPEFHTTLFTPLARLYSHPLLIMPPVPDMSMPFNILSLTSTLYAFCIGGLVNLLVRKSSERIKRQYESATQASTKKSLRDRVRHMVRQSKLGKLIWRTPTETTEPKNPSSESMVANS
jgi:hypothetical protein